MIIDPCHHVFFNRVYISKNQDLAWTMVSGENITILAIGCSNICFGERCRYWGLLYIYGVRTIKELYFLLSYSVNLNWFFFLLKSKNNIVTSTFCSALFLPPQQCLMIEKLFQRSAMMKLSEMRNLNSSTKLFNMWDRCSFQLFADNLTSSVRLRVPEIQKC